MKPSTILALAAIVAAQLLPAAEVTQEQAQTAGKGKYVSVVTVQIDFTDSWVVKIESPILKAVTMVEEDRIGVNVTGASVDVRNGQIEIEFGDVSAASDTPLDS